MAGKNREEKTDPRAVTAARLRMARAAARLNQTQAAERAQTVLSQLSPLDHLSREIIRKYEDESTPYHSLAEQPARAIALAEALGVEPSWLAPDLPLTPEGVARVRAALEDLAIVWPGIPAKKRGRK